MGEIGLQELFNLGVKESSFLNFLDLESKNCPLLGKHVYSKKHDKFKHRLIKQILDSLNINTLEELINQQSPNQHTMFDKLYAAKNLKEAKEVIDLSESVTKEQKEFLKRFIFTINTGLDKNTFLFKTNLDSEVFNKISQRYGYLILKFIAAQQVLPATTNENGKVVSYQQHKIIKNNKNNFFKQDSIGNYKYSIQNNKISFFSEKKLVSQIKALLDEYQDIKEIIDEQDSYGENLLILCAANGYAHAVKLLTEYKANPDLQNEVGNTAVHLALVNKHWSVVNMLLENGVDVNIKNVLGLTPLTSCILKHCDINLVENLLNRGADPNISPNGGLSALSMAVNHERADLVKLLLEHGADINAQDFQGNSPILRAVNRKNKEIVKILLEYGATPNQRAVNHISPLVIAVAKKEEGIARMLIEKGAKLYAIDSGYNSLITEKIKKKDQLILYVSIINNYPEIIRSLLESGADVNLVDEQGNLPLSTAVVFNNVEIIHMLLEKGADPNIKDRKGKNALIYAARNSPEVLQIILQFHGDIKITDSEENTPLMIAAQYGNTEVIQLLINAGSGINLQNCYGETALMKAVENSNLETIKLLLKYGADINIKDQYGSTATLKLSSDNPDILSLLSSPAQYDSENQYGETIIHLASRNGYLKVLNYLSGQGIDVNKRNREGHTAFMSSVVENNIESAKLLLNAGADINIPDHYGEISFFRAINYGNFKTVKLLLEHGIDPNIVTNAGDTVLMLAVQQNGSIEIIRTLLHYKADINIKNHRGETALIKAVSKRDYFSGHLNVIKLLLEAGADSEVANYQGITALMKAVNRGQTDVVKLLLERKANPDMQDKMGNNAIMVAIKTIGSSLEFLNWSGKQPIIEDKEANVYHSIIKLLLEFGSNFDMQNNHGLTALTMAVIKNDFKSARILLKKGCNPNIQTKFGNTALDYASSTNNQEMINLLHKYNANQTDKDIKDVRIFSSDEFKTDSTNIRDYKLDPDSEQLINSAKRGDIEIIKSTLANNSNSNISIRDCSSALYNAIYMKHKEVVRILLNYVVSNNINIVDTLLCTAISSGEIEIVETLLEYKVDPNKPDNFGHYPLIQAAEKDSFEMVKLLTEYGAEVNILSKNESALMQAGENGNADIVGFLLDNGAYPYIQTKLGESLLTKLAGKGHLKIAELLLQRGININMYKEFSMYSPFLKAVEKEQTAYVGLLLAQGANPDLADLFGCTALMHAAKNGNIEMVKLLLDYGANLDLMDQKKQTAQKYAEQYGYTDIKELLSENTGKLNDVGEIIMKPIKKFLIREQIE